MESLSKLCPVGRRRVSRPKDTLQQTVHRDLTQKNLNSAEVEDWAWDQSAWRIFLADHKPKEAWKLVKQAQKVYHLIFLAMRSVYKVENLRFVDSGMRFEQWLQYMLLSEQHFRRYCFQKGI